MTPMSAPGTFSSPLRQGSCATDPAAASAGRGFTLAEVLVVLVVIGLAAGFAYARFDSDPRQALEREARRFASAVEHAALLAQWKNETLGLSAGGGTYQFWRRGTTAEGERWLPLGDDELLQARALPTPFGVAVQEYAGQVPPPDAIIPLVPSGRNEPYVIQIASPEWLERLSVDPLNRVTLSGAIAR